MCYLSLLLFFAKSEAKLKLNPIFRLLELTFPNGAGTAGQILSTDGNGTLSWVNDSAGNPAGTNGQVQINDGGTFGAVSEGASGQVLKSNGAGVAPSCSKRLNNTLRFTFTWFITVSSM